MPAELKVDSVEDALRILLEQCGDPQWDEVEIIRLGNWASTHVEIEEDFHSELNGPFLDAYSKINDNILRLFALARYDAADARLLKQDDIDEFEFRVKVEEGSSDISDNLWQLLEKLSSELVGKMTGHELVITVLGIGVLVSFSFGIKTYLENRKEIRLDELRNDERKQAIGALEFASGQQAQQFHAIVDLMKNLNPVSARGLETSTRINEELLRATSKTGDVVLGGNHVTRAEAKELIGNARRRPTEKIVEQEMRVVDVNTADPIQTSVVIEDAESDRQYKVTFRDRLIDAASRKILLEALDRRGTAWFRLLMKQVDDNVLSVEILGIAAAGHQAAG